MKVGVFLSDMLRRKKLAVQGEGGGLTGTPALASCCIPVLQIVQSAGSLNG